MTFFVCFFISSHTQSNSFPSGILSSETSNRASVPSFVSTAGQEQPTTTSVRFASWPQHTPSPSSCTTSSGSATPDGKFWTVELFLAELDNLLKHLGIQDDYDLLGQSWGGMLGSCHAINQPKGLHRLVIADSPASMKMWVIAADTLRQSLPPDVQATLLKHEADGTTDSPEYEAAMQVFYDRHVCRVTPKPKDWDDTEAAIKADQTVYLTMNGPSEFFITGTLKDFNIVDELSKIKVPTLLVNGKYDEATDYVMEPF